MSKRRFCCFLALAAVLLAYAPAALHAQFTNASIGGTVFDPSGAPVTSASVVVCVYTDKRWDDIVDAVASVAAQDVLALETLVVVDHNERLQRRARAAFPSVRIVRNEQPRGLSGARNAGVNHATGEVVVFLDDDARAEPDWLLRLLEPYRRPEVIGTGGEVIPRWEAEPPRWLPPEFYWVIGCSYVGLPEEPREIRNPLGAIQNSILLLQRDLPLQGDDERLISIVVDEAQRIGAIV